ncbi:MAG: hypothetical protein ACXVB1_13975 [Pseudobdellovibrionaceae bacterium]
MIRFAILEDARKFVSRGGGDPSSIENLGDSGNSVFSFKNSDGKLQILRFTDSEFRSFDEVTAELNFVNHLYGANIPVAQGLSTKDGELAFWAECSSGSLICSSIAYAPGVDVQEGDELWNAEFFKEWGRNHGLIHQAASKYVIKMGNQRDGNGIMKSSFPVW